MVSTNLNHLFKLYQEFTPTTAIYPGANQKKDEELVYLLFGLLGETEEWFESGYDLKEAGDIFWYISQLCNINNMELDLVYKEAETYCIKYKPNIAEAAKKYLRDYKDPHPIIYEYMLYIISLIRNTYSCTNIYSDIDETIKTILMQNTDKLTDRSNRGVLKGDGDNR